MKTKINEESHEKQWSDREERRQFLRANINLGTFRMVLERNINGAHTARPLHKIRVKP